MALYDEKTIVVIDDNIYDHMENYKHILCRKDFGIPPEKIKFIKLSDLSATIPADRIDDFAVYFYIFEKINTAEEYEAISDKLIKSSNVNIVVLHCQDTLCFDVEEDEKVKNKPIRYVHSINIVNDFSLEEAGQLTDREKQARNCLNLSALLYFLLSFEEGTFDDLTIRQNLNYPSLYGAAQYTLLEYKKEVERIEAMVAAEQECIQQLGEEKPHRYECIFSENSVNAQIAAAGLSQENSEQALKQLSALYADCENEVERAIARDINAVRYAMAEMDEFAKGGKEPGFFGKRTELEEPVTVDNLLKNVELNEGRNLNIKQAINLAKGLVTTEKPGVKPFLFAGGVAVLLFLLSIASVYLVNIIKNGSASVDMRLLLVCVLVPVAILLVAGVVGFVMNINEFKKIKKLLSGIRSSINNRTNGMDSLVERVRQYLNDFLTVFCNFHAKDFRVSQCEKRIFALEKEREEIIEKMSSYNEIADLVKILHDYEKEIEAKEGANESYDDTLYCNDDTAADYGIDAYEFDDADKLLFDQEEAPVQVTETGLVRYANCKQCIEAIAKSRKETKVHGNESSAFDNRKCPWILRIEIDDCVNGGVL